MSMNVLDYDDVIRKLMEIESKYRDEVNRGQIESGRAANAIKNLCENILPGMLRYTPGELVPNWVKNSALKPSMSGDYLCVTLIPNSIGGYDTGETIVHYHKAEAEGLSYHDEAVPGAWGTDGNTIVLYWMPLPDMPEVNL